MNPLISVIIPVYNVENYLKEAVLSVCGQTYSNIEIILVNDGSLDNSSYICDELADKDSRIKVIHKNNGGLSSARNTGIDHASGDFLFFLDGDDYISQETISILLKQIQNKEDIGIVSAPCFYSFDNNKVSIYRNDWEIKTQRIIPYSLFCQLTLEQKICFSACCKLYKKELFKNLRFREGKRNEDTLFMFDISFILEKKKLNMIEVTDKLYYYRVNIGSISRNIAFPINIDYIENLNDMMNDTTNSKVIKCLKYKYYNEIISFKSILFLDKIMLNAVDKSAMNKFKKHYDSIKFGQVFKFASKKNLYKYIIINYFPFVYHLFYKTKLLLK